MPRWVLFIGGFAVGEVNPFAEKKMFEERI